MTSSSAGALTANHNTNQVLNAYVPNEENKTFNYFTVWWVTASINKDFFPFKMYMGRSEFGNETDRALAHNVDTDIDMLDDLERSKHYKTNIMQDFNDRQSGYGSRYVSLRLFLNDNV